VRNSAGGVKESLSLEGGRLFRTIRICVAIEETCSQDQQGLSYHRSGVDTDLQDSQKNAAVSECTYARTDHAGAKDSGRELRILCSA